ncbi:hypothetical protein EZS27_027649, partial [termite gut metagenome]
EINFNVPEDIIFETYRNQNLSGISDNDMYVLYKDKDSQLWMSGRTSPSVVFCMLIICVFSAYVFTSSYTGRKCSFFLSNRYSFPSMVFIHKKPFLSSTIFCIFCGGVGEYTNPSRLLYVLNLTPSKLHNPYHVPNQMNPSLSFSVQLTLLCGSPFSTV